MANPQPWPSVLVPSSEDWSLRGGTRSGGQTFQGNEQIVASPTARWKASLTIPAFTADQVRAARRVIALGRSASWFVGPWEYPRAPYAQDAYGRLITPKLLRRPELDGTPYADGGAQSIAATLIPASLLTSIDANATACQIRMPMGTAFRSPDIVSTTPGKIQPGAMFQIGGNLHIVTDVDGISGDTTSVRFRPWARAGFGAGTVVVLVAPIATMRLATDDTGELSLALSRTGSITVDLVEAF